MFTPLKAADNLISVIALVLLNVQELISQCAVQAEPHHNQPHLLWIQWCQSRATSLGLRASHVTADSMSRERVNDMRLLITL